MLQVQQVEAQGQQEKCHYCPDKPANHKVDRCWRIRTAIRNHFGPDQLPEALARTAGPKPEVNRGGPDQRGGFGRNRGRGGWSSRGRQRPQQWQNVRSKIAALQGELDALALDEPEEDEVDESQPDELFQ